ncbi:hypothetical protein NFJ02_24g54760 [Pycnococcus provasolii]
MYHHNFINDVSFVRRRWSTVHFDIYGRIDDDIARITFERVPGLKRVTRVSVGEKHSLALQAIWYPHVPTAQEHEQGTLRSLAEDAVMRSITEPRAAMDALEYAYYLDSERLWKLCAGVVLGNLDAVLLLGPTVNTINNSTVSKFTY